MNPKNLQLSYKLSPYKKNPQHASKRLPSKEKEEYFWVEKTTCLPIAESTDQSLDDYQDQHDEAEEVDLPPDPEPILIRHGLWPTKTHCSHTKKLRKFSQKIWRTKNIVGI